MKLKTSLWLLALTTLLAVGLLAVLQAGFVDIGGGLSMGPGFHQQRVVQVFDPFPHLMTFGDECASSSREFRVADLYGLGSWWVANFGERFRPMGIGRWPSVPGTPLSCVQVGSMQYFAHLPLYQLLLIPGLPLLAAANVGFELYRRRFGMPPADNVGPPSF